MQEHHWFSFLVLVAAALFLRVVLVQIQRTRVDLPWNRLEMDHQYQKILIVHAHQSKILDETLHRKE